MEPINMPQRMQCGASDNKQKALQKILLQQFPSPLPLLLLMLMLLVVVVVVVQHRHILGRFVA